MSLACDFGVGAGLELVMLKKQFREKPRRVIGAGELLRLFLLKCGALQNPPRALRLLG